MNNTEKVYNNQLNNYLMLPQEINGIGNVYPIGMLEYNHFIELFKRYMLYDIQSLNRLRKQEYLPKLPFKSLFEYLIDIIENKEYLELQEEVNRIKSIPKELFELSLQDEENHEDIIKIYESFKNIDIIPDADNICEIISMTVKNKVIYNSYASVFFIYNEKNEKIGVIDSKNFEEYRKLVMEQNIIFQPKVMPSKRGQEIIDKEMNRGGGEVDLEAIVALVSIHTGKDITDYTYYRLIADFNCIIREITYSEISNYSANGCTDKSGRPLKAPSLTENLGILNNPYNKLLKKSTESDLDRALNKR